ncbi:phage tail tape measure protein [Ruegeria marisrubri]|uniref:phage tail tape measure protein n=1 Tax=Ruegeria marisrubri TaxID=1685379 RepID=UPI001CD2A75E|nr:phage tail tape measure protein [Ruegeria marisrubri]MCA0905122.1 phage tail tape measure protein [Ruegeria marisrubri]
MSRKQQYSASITIGSVLEQSVKKNIGFLKSGLGQVGDSIREVERRQKELAKQRRVLEREGKSVESLDREYEQLERRLKDLRRAQQRWNDAAKASARVGSTFRDMRAQVGRTARAVTIGATVAGGAVFGLAASTASLGDDVAKTADKLGIGITQLQELRYAAERSGVATGQFDTALEKMQKNLGEAAGGTGTAKDALDQLGLSAKDLINLSPDEALGMIADRMGNVETAAERAAIANDIFGRSGVGMINMLRGGSKGLQQLQADARRTGYVLSEQAARDAEVFQDTLLDTQLVMKGLKNTVGAELMPVVTQAMRRVGDALVDNRADVQRWAEGFADGVERALPVVGGVFKGIGKVSSVVGEVITKTADMVGGWENFGIIIGGVLASKTVVAVGKFGSAVFGLGRAMWALAGAGPLVVGAIRAIGAAMIANPIGATIAVIAGGALLIYQNWEKIEPYLRPVLDWMGEKFTWLWENAGKPLIDNLSNGVSKIGEAWEGLRSGLGSVLDWIGQKFEWLLGKVQPVIDGLKWAQTAGATVAGNVGSWFGGGATSSSAANTDQAPAGVGPNRRFALGGAFSKGPIMVGEKGPEIRFEDRAGFIANNRQSRQLADRAARVNALLSKPMAMGRGGGAVAAGSSVVQNIHIDASGMSPQEMVRELQRYQRQASGNGLYDRVSDAGPLGR